MHLELFVEEASAEAALGHLIPKILPGTSFRVHSHQGKLDLLRKLSGRLRGYRRWLPEDWRIVVLLDADQADCRRLKAKMEELAQAAGLRTRTAARERVQVINRLAIEELEAWFFGDVEAMRAAYPRLSLSLSRKGQYRDPDAIRGGTWEALERELQRAGYHRGGLGKIAAAREISVHMVPERNRSRSFQAFRSALVDLSAAERP